MDERDLKTKRMLEIGPYQAMITPCPKINFGKGVCGSAWKFRETQIVKDVTKCDNYIACDSETMSEIVLPVFDRSGKRVV